VKQQSKITKLQIPDMKIEHEFLLGGKYKGVKMIETSRMNGGRR
jgi:predicted Zn-dependent protease with MMP-like domain